MTDSERAITEDERIRQFRTECSQVHNFPLASLCSSALTGDARARIRVLAIMAGQGDPGPEAPTGR